MSTGKFSSQTDSGPENSFMSVILPAIFFGHGNPMNAVWELRGEGGLILGNGNLVRNLHT